MRAARLVLAASLAILPLFSQVALSAESRSGQILERFRHANRWRDHVMVVAHRAGGLQAGHTLYPENSLAALDAAIAMGAEMVETDVRRSRDGVFVIMHDNWLDRTTTCKGEVERHTLSELRGCRLVVEGTGRATDEAVPTLREFLAVARGRILVNLDNKLDVASLPAMVEVARDLGMAEQVVVKENLWNDDRIAKVRAILRPAGDDFHFMPIIADDAVEDAAFVEKVGRIFSPYAMEMIAWRNGAETVTDKGGPLFTPRMRAVAVRGDWHLWADTYAIVNKPGGFLAGGRGDELAVAAGLPAESWGFWVDRGATIIQTDEPAKAIEWLAAHGYRVPYDGAAGEPAATASIN